MINLGFLNNALGKVSPPEFAVLYYIANHLALKGTSRAKIYREQIADKLNISTKQVSRITDALAGKGFIKKDEVADSSVGKSVNYYSLVSGGEEDKDVQDTNPNLDKNVPLKKNINKGKKVNNIKSFKKGSEKRNDFTDFVDDLVSDCEREADESL